MLLPPSLESTGADTRADKKEDAHLFFRKEILSEATLPEYLRHAPPIHHVRAGIASLNRGEPERGWNGPVGNAALKHLFGVRSGRMQGPPPCVTEDNTQRGGYEVEAFGVANGVVTADGNSNFGTRKLIAKTVKRDHLGLPNMQITSDQAGPGLPPVVELIGAPYPIEMKAVQEVELDRVLSTIAGLCQADEQSAQRQFVPTSLIVAELNRGDVVVKLSAPGVVEDFDNTRIGLLKKAVAAAASRKVMLLGKTLRQGVFGENKFGENKVWKREGRQMSVAQWLKLAEVEMESLVAVEVTEEMYTGNVSPHVTVTVTIEASSSAHSHMIETALTKALPTLLVSLGVAGGRSGLTNGVTEAVAPVTITIARVGREQYEEVSTSGTSAIQCAQPLPVTWQRVIHFTHQMDPWEWAVNEGGQLRAFQSNVPTDARVPDAEKTGVWDRIIREEFLSGRFMRSPLSKVVLLHIVLAALLKHDTRFPSLAKSSWAKLPRNEIHGALNTEEVAGPLRSHLVELQATDTYATLFDALGIESAGIRKSVTSDIRGYLGDHPAGCDYPWMKTVGGDREPPWVMTVEDRHLGGSWFDLRRPVTPHVGQRSVDFSALTNEIRKRRTIE